MSACDNGNNGAIQCPELCRRFSLSEIKRATINFDDNLVIGKGGFGKVYKGFMDRGSTIVAIKRLNAESKQGAREFWTEIKMLSELPHPHLVTLIGYCDEEEEMILVYEYMANGTLADHLYGVRRKGNGKDPSHLTWDQRLNICLGAARGLNHLHSNTIQSVIHRDMKSTNILLDENWLAKVSDFGLSKLGNTTSQAQTHVSTDIKGTFGYFDPEYFLTHRLTKKSDVYAFGVVLLEVLCGRPAVDRRLDEEQCGLAQWAQKCIQKGVIDQIIDPSLRGQISPHCLKLFAEIANKCLHNHPRGRPSMAEVVAGLELLLASEADAPRWKGVISEVFLKIAQVIANGVNLWRRKWKDYYSNNRLWLQSQTNPFSENAVKLYRRFSLSEIRAATNNFHEHLVIGHDGFTKVYTGLLDGGKLEVAIRRWKEGRSNERNLDQCRAEIQVQSQLRHINIVSLIGYCNDKNEIILIYDYMVHGSLYHHLYETQEHLSWEKRLEICVGAARGLQYLHTGTKQAIIHHNLKPTTILLDENWVAKVSGFEFSTVLTQDSTSASSTFIAGTVGYMDPEYLVSTKITVKSDVYSFGVILLELLCGRKPMILSRDENQVNLVRWFRTNRERGTVDQIIDRFLIGKIAPQCLEEYVKIAESCVWDEGIERPSMDDVLGDLRFALKLQETWRKQTQLDDRHPQNLSDDIVDGEINFMSLEGSDYFSGNLAR